MKSWNRIWQILFVMALSTAAMGQNVAEKDLALVLERGPDRAIRFQNSGTTDLFPATWYQQVLNSFRTTVVGDAIERENRWTDWQLVGLRVAPCMPLGLKPSDNVSEHCWPEVRLVWQPIVRAAAPQNFFADDRAIHATYDVFPSDALSGDELQRVISLRNRLYQYYRGGQNPNVLLTASEELDFQELRNKVVNRMLGNTLWLRSQPTANGNYTGHGLRPEYASGQGLEFRSRLLLWLQAYTPGRLIKEVTAFSLPAGRAPARINRWTFIAFDGQSGQLQPRSIAINSAVDGRTLFNFGTQETATRQQDDFRLINASFGPAAARELGNSVIFNAVDRNRLLPRLADRQQILVPNTSCASCHRFQTDPNNFHNMSYFVGLPQISLAERTQRDVAWDLNWLTAHQARIATGSLEPEL